jgi:hypothetical protein
MGDGPPPNNIPEKKDRRPVAVQAIPNPRGVSITVRKNLIPTKSASQARRAPTERIYLAWLLQDVLIEMGFGGRLSDLKESTHEHIR